MATTVMLPAVRRGNLGADRLKAFEAIKRRFAWQAWTAVIIVGLTGFYMSARLDLWERFKSSHFWWMHAMVCVWLLFTLILFVADALVLSVPVASDAPASSGARASARRPRLARPENDGGNNASAANPRTLAPNADRALRFRPADRKRTADIPGRLAGTRERANQLTQHSPRLDVARSRAGIECENPCRREPEAFGFNRPSASVPVVRSALSALARWSCRALDSVRRFRRDQVLARSSLPDARRVPRRG
jgi:hypothetical protein